MLRRGAEAGAFRPGVEPVELYVKVASLCYFPISNAHTLRAVFGCAIDDRWLAAHERDVVRMVLGFLAPETPS